jgi:Putative prokaryotic signal transducing protein
MALVDPVAVYNAKTNAEALMLRVLLEEIGIEAFATEDLSPAGAWAFGTLPEIHKPQVWVSRVDAERARAAIHQYEDETARAAHPHRPASESAETGEPIDVECDECGHVAGFPAEQEGTIQDCPNCGAYVDVGEFDDSGMNWQEGADDE